MPTTETWTGGTGVWSVGANWSGGSKPGALDAAVFNATSDATLTNQEYEDAASLTMSSANAEVDVQGVLNIGDTALNGVSDFINVGARSLLIDGGAIIVGQYLTSASGALRVAAGGTYQWNGANSTQTINMGQDANDSFQFSTHFGGTITNFNAGDIISYSGTVNSVIIGTNKITFNATNGQTYVINLAGYTYNSSNLIVNGNIVESAASLTPAVTPETASVVAGQTVTVSASSGALAGDSDPLGGTLSVTAISNGTTNVPISQGGTAIIAGAYGTLTIGSDGAYSYTATNGLAIVTAGDQEIDDSFSFTVTSSEGNTSTSYLDVIVSLAAGGTETVTNASGSATYTIGATTLTLNETSASTYAGVIQDGSSGNTGGSVVVSGSAPLTLTGASTYTGKTSVSGTLDLAGAGSIATSSKVSLTASGATLDISGATSPVTINKLGGVAGSVVDLGAGTLNINEGVAGTVAGVIKDGGAAGGLGGSLAVAGAAPLTLSGVNTYTGKTSVSGTLDISGSGSIATSSKVSLTASGATFDISGASAAVTINKLGGVAGSVIDLGAGTLNVNEGVAGTFAGVIQDGGAAGGVGGNLSVAGPAPLTLTGVSTYTGKTSVSGTLALAGTASIHSASKVSLTMSGATLDISGATAGEVINKLGGISGTVVALGSQNLKIKVQGGTVDTFAGTIKDGGIAGGSGGSITVGGLGELSLTAADSYTGGTTIAAGTLDIAALGAAGMGTITFANPPSNGVATLDIDAAALTSVTPTIVGVTSQYDFANKIAGATTTKQVIDLTSLAYVQGLTTATLAGTTLNVNDGSSDVTLHLASSQSKSSFTTASDGHGGTLVYDPPTQHPAAKVDTSWIEMAMADFGGVGGQDYHHTTMHDPYAAGAAASLEHHHGPLDTVLRRA